MNREILLQKYNETCSLADAKDAQVSSICYSWGNLNNQYSDTEIKMMIEKLESEATNLRAQANAYLSQYDKIVEQERAKQQAIIAAKTSVKREFGVSPDDLIITGGVLSSNASESHLIGREKNPEEKTQEKERILSELKAKVMKKEISLEDASKLVQDIDTAYGTLETPLEETQSEMHR